MDAVFSWLAGLYLLATSTFIHSNNNINTIHGFHDILFEITPHWQVLSLPARLTGITDSFQRRLCTIFNWSRDESVSIVSLSQLLTPPVGDTA